MIRCALYTGLAVGAALLSTGCGCHALSRRPAAAPAIVSSAPFAPAAPACPDPVPGAPTPVQTFGAPAASIPGGYR
jgi:hypothetical protein